MIGVFARYLGVQVVAYGFDMGTFLLLSTWLGMTPVVANIFAKLVAGAFAFLMHRRLTFAIHREGGARGQLLRYALLLALNVPLASGLLLLLLPWLSPAPLAKLASDVICVVATFLLSRHVVFVTPPR